MEFLIHEVELKNNRGAVETSLVIVLACFYNKMFYQEFTTSKKKTHKKKKKLAPEHFLAADC